MTERRLTKDQTDGTRKDVEDGATGDWFQSSTDAILLALIHDLKAAKTEIEQLREAKDRTSALIQKVLDDEESRPGAWGPDVTCLGHLNEAKAALKEK